MRRGRGNVETTTDTHSPRRIDQNRHSHRNVQTTINAPRRTDTNKHIYRLFINKHVHRGRPGEELELSILKSGADVLLAIGKMTKVLLYVGC